MFAFLNKNCENVYGELSTFKLGGGGGRGAFECFRTLGRLAVCLIV